MFDQDKLDDLSRKLRFDSMETDQKWAHIYTHRELAELCHLLLKLTRQLMRTCSSDAYTSIMEDIVDLENRISQDEKITLNPFTGENK